VIKIKTKEILLIIIVLFATVLILFLFKIIKIGAIITPYP